MSPYILFVFPLRVDEHALMFPFLADTYGAWYIVYIPALSKRYIIKVYCNSVLKLQMEEPCGCLSSLYTREKHSTFTCFNFVSVDWTTAIYY